MSARPAPIQIEAERLRQAEAPAALVVHDLGDLLQARPRAIRYVVERLAPCGFVTLCSAHGGAGKSIIFGTVLGGHVAAGVPVFGLGVIQGRVLFVSLEDPAEVVRERLHHVVGAYGLDAESVAANFIIVAPPPGGDPVLAQESNDFGQRQLRATATMEELAELATGCVAIIVDNASDAYNGNENDRPHVRTFMRMLGKVATDNGAAMILLAHIDKNAARFGGGGNTYSGSTAWHNSARSRLTLTEKSGLIELHQEKLNLGRKLDEPILLRWSDIHSTFMPVGQGEAVAESGADAEQVLQAIRLAGVRGTEVKAARSGPATTQRILETFDLPANLRGPRGRDAFWAAIGNLHSTGRIEERDGWTASRHRCRVITETGAPVPIAAQVPTPRHAEPAKPAIPASADAGIASSQQLAQTRETREAIEYRRAASGE